MVLQTGQHRLTRDSQRIRQCLEKEVMLSWMIFVRHERRYKISVFSTIQKYYSFLYKQNVLAICQGLINSEKDFGMDKEN